MAKIGSWERVSDYRIKCSVGIWRAIDTELVWLGFGLSGKTCPISLIIDYAVRNLGYPDFDKVVEIEFPERKQADLVQRVFDDRISKFGELNGQRVAA